MNVNFLSLYVHYYNKWFILYWEPLISTDKISDNYTDVFTLSITISNFLCLCMCDHVWSCVIMAYKTREIQDTPHKIPQNLSRDYTNYSFLFFTKLKDIVEKQTYQLQWPPLCNIKLNWSAEWVFVWFVDNGSDAIVTPWVFHLV